MSAPWGKFDAEKGTRHHLAHHCADVAACFQHLVKLPVIKKRLDRAASRALSDRDLDRLAALVFLHDAGKLHPGFQSRGWPNEKWNVAPRGHVREGLEIFLVSSAGANLTIADLLAIETLGAWGVCTSLLRAVISHHGRPAPPDLSNFHDVQKGWQPAASYDPLVAARTMGELMRCWFPTAFEHGGSALPDRAPALEHFVCGLTTLADWLGSDARWFPHVGDLDSAYMEHARLTAAKACAAVGLDAGPQRSSRTAPATFTEISGFPKPNAQQELIGQTSLDAPVVILEAETGSGKTEAALWHYLRLFDAGHVDGLYFAVPTRSAAMQLHGRVVKAVQRVFGKATPQPVLAVPGYLRAGDIDGTALPHWRVRWDDADQLEQSELDRRWAAEHAKRYLAAQIAVGTVDQAMLGALTIKHAHLRAASLSRSLLVIDEVHASDAYMTAVQKRLLEAHLAVGGYAMLMSATLGSVARTHWLGQTSVAFDEAVDTPYPAVWSSTEREPRTPSRTPNSPKQVAMDLLSTMAPDVTAQHALDAAREGARVLVIRNTANHAVETLQSLETMLQPGDKRLLFRVGDIATLHHSRFAPADRRRLDAAVECALSTNKERVPDGRIVIGTQTLEQSLDIDADLLVTDLCPIDVLLQRIGRLHRHKLRRPPGFEQPRCIVMVPERGLAALLKPDFENGLGAWRTTSGVLQGVYRDLSILELTRRLITLHPRWTIPDMNRLLVESAIHPERIETLHRELGPAWATYRNDVVGSEVGDRLAAQGVLIDRTQPFESLQYPSATEENIRTRLGDDTIRFELAEPHPVGPFGEQVTEIILPARWVRDVPVDEHHIEHSQNRNEVLLSISQRQFRYGRYGLVSVGDRDGAQSAQGSADPARDP